MPDRWSWAHLGYISYDYRCKGDRFSRGEAPSPAVYATGKRADGTPYLRRVRTSEALGVTVREVLAKLTMGMPARKRARLGELLAGTVCYLDPLTRRLEVRLADDGKALPAGVPLTFASTLQRLGGARWWWSCPRCDRRCSTLYAVTATRGPGAWVGCRECLGLTYPSRSLHKTQGMDRKLLAKGPLGTSAGALMRAAQRDRRRLERIVAQIGKLGSF